MKNYGSLADNILKKISFSPDIAVVMGSGLANISSYLEGPKSISYESLQGYPQTTIHGHSGKFVFGKIGHVKVLLAIGRFHYYEGYSLEEVTAPIKLFSKLKIKDLIITNSAGSMNEDFPPGSFLISNGHMDCTFLKNSNEPQVVSDAKYHNPKLIKIAMSCSKKLKLKTNLGIYCWTMGPAYETPAEIKNMQQLGGDAVGMSTVPEIIEAGYRGMRVLTMSCLTNFAAGISQTKLTHEEVVSNAKKFDNDFSKLLERIIKNIYKN